MVTTDFIKQKNTMPFGLLNGEDNKLTKDEDKSMDLSALTHPNNPTDHKSYPEVFLSLLFVYSSILSRIVTLNEHITSSYFLGDSDCVLPWHDSPNGTPGI